MSVDAGRVTAIVGPNGAGKTSVIRAIAGLDEIGSGAIAVNGQEWANHETHLHLEPALRSTSVVLADPLLFPHLSVADNVAFGLRARGLSRASSRDQASSWLDRVDLANYATSRPSELSTGQQQRVSLARALAIEPDVLLLDEPLTLVERGTDDGGDAPGIVGVMEYLYRGDGIADYVGGLPGDEPMNV